MDSKASDEYWMRRALRIACLAREARPNPMVGCVIVDSDGHKISEGYTQAYGKAHAEATALAKIDGNAPGATVYVTLEPCSITSKTPPCSDALIRAEVARVVVAMVDPDSRVNGNGIRQLQDAGIQVDVGICEDSARELNAAFIKHRSTNLPLVTVKTAMTLDGKIATVSGDSRWITSEITRKWVHRQLRSRNQAILVGIGTVFADNPELTVRLTNSRKMQQPLRIIVDSNLRTPLDSQVVKNAGFDALTVIAYSFDPDNRVNTLEKVGVRCIKIAPTDVGKVDLHELLLRLGNDFKIISVLVEAGPEICASLFSSKCVDIYYSCIGARIVGGFEAPGPVGGVGLTRLMSDAFVPNNIVARRSGTDLVIRCDFSKKV